MMFEDQFLPTYDVSDGVAVTVAAPPDATYAALMETDLIELGKRRPLVGLLGGLRVLPDLLAHLLHGEPPAAPPPHMRLKDMSDLPMSGGGWVLLGERPGEEIALGLVGKFWRPVIEFADVPAEEFREFSEPGFAKTIYVLSTRPLHGGRTLLAGVMRTATTDDHARRWFRRYWTFGVGSGAHLLVGGLLDAAREEAERETT